MLHFLIEMDIWDNEPEIVDILVQKKIPFALHPCEDFDYKFVKSHTQYFCYGSLQWVNQIKNQNDPNLLCMANFPNFDCHVYYPHFQYFLFNANTVKRTLKEFIAEKNSILEDYGGKVFMRPDKGFKNGSISGGIFTQSNFAEEIAFFTEAMQENEIVLFDTVKHIDREYRAIIANEKCITGSQYKSFDLHTNRLGVDPDSFFPSDVKGNASFYAYKVGWSPDDLYVLDIVESMGKLSVMEINALSTSGWYDSDIGQIVDSIVHYYKGNYESNRGAS
jgi:hypothetical protein